MYELRIHCSLGSESLESSPKSSEGSARLYSRGWANGEAGRRKFRDWYRVSLDCFPLSFVDLCIDQTQISFGTYHAVRALCSLSVDTASAPAGIVCARVHG